MYAQAVRTRTFRRYGAKQTSAFEHVQKCTRGCSFSNEPCDRIKSLKLGESNEVNRAQLKYFGGGLSDIEKNNAITQMNGLLDTFKDAREYGSILDVDNYDWNLLRRFAFCIVEQGQMTFDSVGLDQTQATMSMIIDLGEAMAKKNDIVVTNLPYMGNGGMGSKLSDFVKTNFKDSKTDLFAVFIEVCGKKTKKNGLFCAWMKKAYGTDTLEENLDFISAALGNKGGSSREVIRNYFMNDFFKDHCSVYSVANGGKRPIYWMFDSGKENGFKALIYMHRYDQDTVGRVRTDYLHKTQKAIEQAMQSAQYTLDNSNSSTEKSKVTKRISKYTKQLAEIQLYDEAIAHIANQRIPLDLDDGVKVNYAKLQGVEVSREGMKTVKVDLLAKI